MNVIVTGSNGFVGKNLVATLNTMENIEVYEFNRQTSDDEFEGMCADADFIFHLAGVNRPENTDEFKKGNTDLTKQLVEKLEALNNPVPILLSSSIQAELDNSYGKSKLAAEKIIKEYEKNNEVKTLVYRLPNLFGKWSKPNYNSVVATFCHNIAHDKEIQVNDPNVELELAYIDDVINEFISAMNSNGNEKNGIGFIPITHKVTLGELASLIKSFKNSRTNRMIPNMNDSFVKKLYSTYLTYLSKDNFSYPLIMHGDERGSFTEFTKSKQGGQVSINVSKPGITKGGHWHHTKNEKFLVVSGQAIIRFRHVFSDEIIEYEVSENKLEVVDIPPGYTHSIENIESKDLVTVMWVNELFDPDNTDTYPLEV